MASQRNPPVQRPSVILGPLPLNLNYTELPSHTYVYRRSDTSLTPYPYNSYRSYNYHSNRRNWHDNTNRDSGDSSTLENSDDSDDSDEDLDDEEEEVSFKFENVFRHLFETCIRYRAPEVTCDSVPFTFNAKEMIVIKSIMERVKNVYEQREEEGEEEDLVPSEFLLDDGLFLSANRCDLALEFLEDTMDSYFNLAAHQVSENLSKNDLLQKAIIKCLVTSVNALSSSQLSQKMIFSFDQVLRNLLQVLKDNQVPEWLRTSNHFESIQQKYL